MSKLNDAHSTLVSALRGGRGWFTKRKLGPRPEAPLELYDMEN